MDLARLHKAGALLVALLLLVLTAAPGADAACNATCKRDIDRCMATQCAGVPRAACRRHCKPAAIRTLAYYLFECHTDATGLLSGHAALRIRRGDHDPITVLDVLPQGPPIPDPQGACRTLGESRLGWAQIVAGGLERIGVSPDGASYTR